MSSFRLLTKRKLLLLSTPAGWRERLYREGYDVLEFTDPRSAVVLGLRLLVHRRRFHFLVGSPLPAARERVLRRFLRLFPFLVASWTRLEANAKPTEIAPWLESRLVGLAERDYDQQRLVKTPTQGRQHGTSALHAGTPARARSEFDHLLETPAP